MKIILTGGGTIGSVSPLLAIRTTILEKYPEAVFLWIGTEDGHEEAVVRRENIAYFSIKSGKLRRYFSLKNFTDPFRAIVGIVQAIKIIKDFQPDLILSAGSFVSVPAVIAAWLTRRRVIVHQQDLRPGMANKLMAPLATKITVSFPESLNDFSKKKTVLTGNPVRPMIFRGRPERAEAELGLEKDLPTLLVMGGSQGAVKINELIFSIVPELIAFCQIIHLVGKGNIVEWAERDQFGAMGTRYQALEYLHELLPAVYARADLVICRAGLSTLTELAALGLPTILIPIAGHQQAENAEYFNKKNAVIVFEQAGSPAELLEIIRALAQNASTRRRLGEYMRRVMPADANAAYLRLIEQLLAISK